MAHYIGVDVGTGSARAGVFDADGGLLGGSQRAIAAFRPAPDFVQQSSADIWSAVSESVRGAVREARVDPASVRGVGFDATCSLVVSDAAGGPVTVSPDGAREQEAGGVVSLCTWQVGCQGSSGRNPQESGHRS